MNAPPPSSDADVELGRWIGSRIRHIRVMKNMTQEELAQRMGTQRPAVSNWENAINIPSLPTLRKMGDIFGVPIRSLLEADGEDAFDGPMIPLETAVDRPGLERWIRLYERLSDLGEDGQRLLGVTMRLFGRLGAIADAPHRRTLFASVTWMVRQSFDFALNLLLTEDRRKTETFLREINVRVNMDDHQGRLAHINQLFVPPVGYTALFEQVLRHQHVVVLVGQPHAGKSFLALKLLMDLAEAGYRPHYRSGAVMAPAGARTRRLADLLCDGQAVLLDDPFAPEAGSLALREFVAAPGAAIDAAARADARLILAIDEATLQDRPAAARLLHPHVWPMDGRQPESTLVRMLVNYSEVYHPEAREPIVLSLEGLDTPHAIERTFAVASDNRQTIRRRSASVRRAGLDDLLLEDLGALGDAELTLLLLVRHVPLPWGDLASVFSALEVRGIGGEAVSAEGTLAALQRWLVATESEGADRIGFHHLSYATVLDRAGERDRRVSAVLLQVIAQLASASDPVQRQLALRIAGVIEDNRQAADILVRGSADRMMKTVATVLRERDALDGAQRADLAAAFAAPPSELYVRHAAWLDRYRHELPDVLRREAAWLDGDDLWARLAAASADGATRANLDRGTREAAVAGDAMLRTWAAQLAIAAADRIDVGDLVRLVRTLAADSHAGVAAATRRALLDRLEHVPADRREAVLRAAW